jgi:hypothetical protein
MIWTEQVQLLQVKWLNVQFLMIWTEQVQPMQVKWLNVQFLMIWTEQAQLQVLQVQMHSNYFP